jgi:hypothetical protein
MMPIWIGMGGDFGAISTCLLADRKGLGVGSEAFLQFGRMPLRPDY